MKLTSKLKNWAVKNTDVESDATEDQFKQAIGAAVIDGSLPAQKFTELSTTPEDEAAGEFKSFMSDLSGSLKELRDIVAEEKGVKKGKKKPPKDEDDDYDDDKDEDDEKEAKDDQLEEEEGKPKKRVMNVDFNDDREDEEEEGKPAKGKKPTKKSEPTKLQKMISSSGRFGSFVDDEIVDGKGVAIRVKSAAERYSTTKTAATYPLQSKSGKAHPYAGQPIQDYSDPQSAGRPMDTPSELDKAVSGSFSKFLVAKAMHKSATLAWMQLPEHDKEILAYAMDNYRWGGASDGGNMADIKDRRLTPNEQKALIDDSTSGGIEAAPIVFDDMVIMTPLLNGELFPLVTTIPLDRGRRVEGAAVVNVTSNWGGVDDTSIALFDTTSYVTAFDTTVFRWEGSIRIGLDFLTDTPIDFGQIVTFQYGERLLADLDNVIATGDGATQPEGVMVHAGTTSINFGGTTTIGNYESLRFGVTKQEHKSTLVASAVFCGSETSYMRARAVPVGANDARRLGGAFGVTLGGVTNYADYQWMGIPYKINAGMGNTKVFYAILARYRMYRRRGLTIRTSTEGDTLIRRNEMLLVATARYGGQLERGAVAAVTTSAPA